MSPSAQSVHDSRQELTALLRCPTCRAPDAQLSASADSLHCAQCNTEFPSYPSGRTAIPWLFTNPDATRLEWKARVNGFLHHNANEQRRLSEALAGKGLSNVGQQRLKLQLDARRAHLAQIADVLAPLGLDDIDFLRSPQSADLLPSKLPANQGLLSYYDNIFRDWAWNNGENDHLLGTVRRVLKADARTGLGKVLTLGAGACRLPYDVHREYAPTLSVALDFNPLLLLTGSRIIQGETVSLYEFPIAALNHAAYAVDQDCAAPKTDDPAACANFHCVFGDALNPPFAAQSFNTVMTPWLIDIIPQDLAGFIPNINHLLDDDGVWINTGSLAFFHKEERWRYSEEEVLELIENTGFELLAVERREVPYLNSPHSAHGRTETVLSFAARKIGDTGQPPRHDYLPDWILDTAQAVPELAEHVVASSHHLFQAQVLGAIDGKRSIDEIGAALAQKYGFDTDEAVHAVKRVLIEDYEN